MKLRVVLFAGMVASGLCGVSCSSRHDTDEHEQEVHAGAKPKPAPAAAPTSLRDTVQLLVQQLDTVRRIGCWDEDFARVMSVHHAGAQRLAAVEVSQGKDSTLRAQAQHVLKGHERDNHVLTLALTREPPAGQEYRPGNARDPFVRRMTAALAPLRELPPASGSLDTDFATLMVRHHQSGVALAQTELAYGRNAEVKAAARNIVRDEQAEVRQYQRWLQTHSASLPSPKPAP
ncbi:DUF305 domain-containing protein [Hymenobacter sp. BT186]|uniref:DUF305 domain-containing protein n=1 Tax=Hymenobacter telluris TaxID=2816474 RepID=A0A939F353_9BACT|nr:DUF305 domain-containing protein [Hymenobacter telluris]MBO0360518.1 DUF305 domain-containing protein [Hymenobacter telluris]MBW3376545.1 DUF305 domain-containing protein [Hymenobacter norwichensis]